MKLYIRAYPKFTKVVSASGSLSDIKALSRKLTDKERLSSSSLYSRKSEDGGANEYYLCFEAEARKLESQLGAICEHSERVFIGRYYYSIIREHYIPIIQNNAAAKLSQK